MVDQNFVALQEYKKQVDALRQEIDVERKKYRELEAKYEIEMSKRQRLEHKEVWKFFLHLFTIFRL